MSDTSPFLVRRPEEPLSAYVGRLEVEVNELPELERSRVTLTTEIGQLQLSLKAVDERIVQAQAASERLEHLSELLGTEAPPVAAGEATPATTKAPVDDPVSPPTALAAAPEIAQATPAEPETEPALTYPERIARWASTASALCEYTPRMIADETGIERNRLGQALRPLLEEGMLIKLEHPSVFPTYVKSEYLWLRDKLLEAVQGDEAVNLLGVIERVDQPVNVEDAKYILESLAQDGLIFIFSDVGDETGEAWFSDIRPEEEVVWVVEPPKS